MPRPADRRAKIELLRAAEAVFVEHGLAAAKVEDITGQAGVSKGAFYLHFDSKEDCFRQIVEGFIAKLSTCVDAAPPLTSYRGGIAGLVESLDVWRAHDVETFEFCWQNRGLMRLIQAGGGGASFAYLIDEFAERVSQQIETWARHMIDAGIYRADLEPSVLRSLIAGGYDRLVRDMIKQSKRPDLGALARQAQALYLRGVLTDEVRSVLDRQVSGDDGAASGPLPKRAREASPGTRAGRAGPDVSTEEVEQSGLRSVSRDSDGGEGARERPPTRPRAREK